jgi:hypothetical protein
MDSKQFLDAITPVLKNRFGQFTVEIKRDHLPTSVLFLVTSTAFEGMSRWARVEVMASIVEEAFGLPLDFGPSGVALTPQEAKVYPWPEEGSTDWDASNDADDTAAGPVSHG